MKTITVAQLRELKACSVQLDAFSRLFPDGVASVTPESCRAHAVVFDWDWAARNLLTPAQCEAYNEAVATSVKAYYEGTAPDWKAFIEATDFARKAYGEAVITAWENYGESVASAWKTYDEARVSAWKALNEVRATSFAEIFNS